MKIKCFKIAARVLDRDCVNRRGLDISKEVMLVSVAQTTVKLPFIKVGGSVARLIAGDLGSNKAEWQIFVYLQL